MNDQKGNTGEIWKGYRMAFGIYGGLTPFMCLAAFWFWAMSHDSTPTPHFGELDYAIMGAPLFFFFVALAGFYANSKGWIIAMWALILLPVLYFASIYLAERPYF